VKQIKNRELLLKVARRIKRHKNLFDMGAWHCEIRQGKDCNTVACVAGWTVIEAFGVENIKFDGDGSLALVAREKYEELRKRGWLGPGTGHRKNIRIDIPGAAESLLGLDRNEAASLFYGPEGWPEEFAFARDAADGAAAYLRHLAGPPPRPRRKKVVTQPTQAASGSCRAEIDTQENIAPEESEAEAVLV
jgi:hypothetical protein